MRWLHVYHDLEIYKLTLPHYFFCNSWYLQMLLSSTDWLLTSPGTARERELCIDWCNCLFPIDHTYVYLNFVDMRRPYHESAFLCFLSQITLADICTREVVLAEECCCLLALGKSQFSKLTRISSSTGNFMKRESFTSYRFWELLFLNRNFLSVFLQCARVENIHKMAILYRLGLSYEVVCLQNQLLANMKGQVSIWCNFLLVFSCPSPNFLAFTHEISSQRFPKPDMSYLLSSQSPVPLLSNCSASPQPYKNSLLLQLPYLPL